MRTPLLAFAFVASASLHAGHLEQVNFTFNGQSRYVVFYVPTDYDAARCHGLVVSCHGLGDSGLNFSGVTNMHRLADSLRAVIAFADGGNDADRDFYTPPGDEHVLTRIIEIAKERYTIHPNRVVMNGFSLGGRSAFLYGDAYSSTMMGTVLFTPVVWNGDGYPVASWDNYNWAGAAGEPIYISVGTGDGWLPNVEAMAIYLYLANQERCVQLYGSANHPECDCQCNESSAATWYNTWDQSRRQFLNHARWEKFSGGHVLPGFNLMLKMFRHIETYADTAGFPPCQVTTGIADHEDPSDGISFHPNPFANSATIGFGLRSPSRVTVELFDVGGRGTRTLLDTHMAAGEHRYTFTSLGDGLPDGVYLLRLVTEEGVRSTRLVKGGG